MEPEAARPRRQHRHIANFKISPIGLGIAPLSIEGRPDPIAGLEVIKRAVDLGITFIDTADAYCISSPREHGYGERLVRDAMSALGGLRSDVMVATKGGEIRPGDGRWLLRGSADHLREACEASLVALGVDVIDLYQLHRPDPAVPLEESLGAMVDMQTEGRIREIGVCNVNLAELELALTVAPIAAVQNACPPHAVEHNAIIDRCDAEGIAFIAHSPFGGPGPARRLARNEAAAGHQPEGSPYAAALRKLLGRSPSVVPIPGTTNPAHLVELASVLHGKNS